MSSLSFIAKLIERVVTKQLNDFTSQEGISRVLQSAIANRRFQTATETALLKILNDISTSVDRSSYMIA